jgi:hypothetical protein
LRFGKVFIEKEGLSWQRKQDPRLTFPQGPRRRTKCPAAVIAARKSTLSWLFRRQGKRELNASAAKADLMTPVQNPGRRRHLFINSSIHIFFGLIHPIPTSRLNKVSVSQQDSFSKIRKHL